MKLPPRIEFWFAGTVLLAVVLIVYAPIIYFGYRLNGYIGNTESQLITEFGQPKFQVTIEQIQSNPSNWPWWGETYGPKPKQDVSHKAYGYPKSGFIIFWVYINQNGSVEYVARVGT